MSGACAQTDIDFSADKQATIGDSDMDDAVKNKGICNSSQIDNSSSNDKKSKESCSETGVTEGQESGNDKTDTNSFQKPCNAFSDM